MKPGDTIYYVKSERPPGPAANVYVRPGRVVSAAETGEIAVYTPLGRVEFLTDGDDVFNDPAAADTWAYGLAVRLMMNFSYQTVAVMTAAGKIAPFTARSLPNAEIPG